MKKTLATLASIAVLTAGAATAQAAWYPDGYGDLTFGTTTFQNVKQFDWNVGTGNADISTAEFYPTQNFTLRYQASLNGLNDLNGQAISLGNFLDVYELTIVAELNETVSVMQNFGPTVYAQLVTQGGKVAMYYDNKDSNITAGTGFNDGTRILEATFLPGQISAYTATGSTAGIGSFNVGSIVSYIDNAFFEPDVALTQLDWTFAFEGTLNQPPSNIAKGYFDGFNGFNRYSTVSGDINFNVDSSSTLTPVPEPSTLLLLGAGLVGVAGLARRKKTTK